MKTWHWLGIIISTGFLARVLIPLGRVFNGDYLNFVSPDSYYHADIMRQGLAVFPHMHGSVYDYFVVTVSWLLGLGHPSVNLMEYVAIFIPPIFAAVTIYLVYLMGKRLFSEKAGILAALIASLIPGEFFARTLLGVIDHHAAEVLLTTCAAAFVIVALTLKKRAWWKYVACLAGVILCMFLYKDTWMGAAFVFQQVASLSYNPVVFPSATASTTTEAVHVWGLPGNYVPMINCIVAILFGWIVFKKGASWKRFFIIAWALFMLLATVWQLRFDYYLIIPAALLFGYGMTLVKPGFMKYVFTGCAIAGVILHVYAGMVKSNLDTPSKDWNETLVWVRENTPPGSKVVAWWPYGYWIRYRAERAAYITGGQEAAEIFKVANCLLSYDTPEWPEELDYLIIDTNTAYNFKRNISIWAGKDYRDIDWQRTLVFRLYTGESQVYGESTKVFKIGEAK